MAAPTSLRVLLGTEDVSAHIDENLTWSNVDPGGFEAASFSFPSRVPVKKGSSVRIEAGLETAFEGRVEEVGHKGQTTVGCIGHGARFKEERIQEIWVDRDLSAWGEMPLNEKIRLATANIDLG